MAQTLEKIDLRKLRGGYYTPAEVSDMLARWAIYAPQSTILEPSCGDGVFLQSAATVIKKSFSNYEFLDTPITAFEINEEEAAKARRITKLARILNTDFFIWAYNNWGTASFDCVLGNPPFIRYQKFPEPSRSIAMSLMKSLGLKPNNLTNIWVPFVAVCTYLLRPRGRLAMVIPTELLQVSYAAQLRVFLTECFENITILACNEMIFPEAEQEVVLLLASGKVECREPGLESTVVIFDKASYNELLTHDFEQAYEPRVVNHDSEKWLKYFLSGAEIDLMRELKADPRITNLRSHAEVDVGVVTGNNRFFLLSMDEARQHRVENWIYPLVSRSHQLKGAVLGEPEWQSLREKPHKTGLFCIPEQVNGDSDVAVRDYISLGESLGVQEGYKCSVRKVWYSVPSIWNPDCFFFRQIYDFPRVVANDIGATCTDTIHRMRCKSPRDQVISNLYSHLTAASAEIEGRSYGGGVLELEPTEAENLLMPAKLGLAVPLEEADRLIRNGRLTHLLEENDRLLLQKHLGLTRRECQTLKDIWDRMRDRRSRRKKRR